MGTAPRQFDLVVFDWDGTLCDSTGLIVQSIQCACRDVGVPVPSDRDAAYVIGLGLRDALALVAPGLPEARYLDMVERYRHHYLGRHHGLLLFPGVPAMLQELRQRGHRLAVATGKARRGLDEALTVADLHGLFDATRTADETASKPDPRMLHELIEHFGVPPQRTLMIGDTTHDLQLALNAGTASLGVSYGAHDHDTFAPFGPRYVAHSVAELALWLEQHA
ncbi:MAG TPA: HAD-IIIA family hydrolase [Burkholderiaceae bacterium]|nr:HAD-IIIA family hydrolase [Burkholderiaceae bacterium]